MIWVDFLFSFSLTEEANSISDGLATRPDRNVGLQIRVVSSDLVLRLACYGDTSMDISMKLICLILGFALDFVLSLVV